MPLFSKNLTAHFQSLKHIFSGQLILKEQIPENDTLNETMYFCYKNNVAILRRIKVLESSKHPEMLLGNPILHPGVILI
jgi:hypothetical protein